MKRVKYFIGVFQGVFVLSDFEQKSFYRNFSGNMWQIIFQRKTQKLFGDETEACLIVGTAN